MTLILRLLAFLTAGLTALPAGWCCLIPAVPCHTVVAAEAPHKACCSCRTEPKSAEVPAAPVEPERKQCCEPIDNVPLSAHLPIVETLALPLFLRVEVFSLERPAIGRLAVALPLPWPDPSLQVLHCTWLC